MAGVRQTPTGAHRRAHRRSPQEPTGGTQQRPAAEAQSPQRHSSTTAQWARRQASVGPPGNHGILGTLGTRTEQKERTLRSTPGPLGPSQGGIGMNDGSWITDDAPAPLSDPRDLGRALILAPEPARGHFIRDPNRSYPVDLHQVSIKLFEWAAKLARREQMRREREQRAESFASASGSSNYSTPTLASRSGSYSPLTPEAQHREYIRYEIQRHGKLVKDGGRPWYPIHLIQDISKNPRDYHDVLRFWQGEFPDSNQDSWMLFGDQLEDWRDFRKWQSQMRQEHSDTFPQYLEKTKARVSEHSTVDVAHLVGLDKDPKQQNRLSTWFEYLSFELSVYQEVSWYKTWENNYEDAWQKLVKSNVLKRNDTRDYIESAECSWNRENEATKVREAVEAARSALLVAERDVLDPNQRGSAVHKKLVLVANEFDSALQVFDALKTRNDQIDEYNRATGDYRVARRQGLRYELLLEWVRDQIPLIQREMEANMDQEMAEASTTTSHEDPTVLDPALFASQPLPQEASSRAPAKRSRPTERVDGQQPKRLRSTSQGPPILRGKAVCIRRTKAASTSPPLRHSPRKASRSDATSADATGADRGNRAS
ncbi:hypothetical protein G7Z17_g12775 [Cylindrodendrum hubeiense]|uniref:Uncharacterized protein n=1 Tax=Cylindrodendrum hubeiense TaxID=595255 RepID=A0A9P5L2T6_9HYPO|nr:hypothetical protein G7Z17_g12775 [Cylindrodendrum hubeiense]